MVKKEIFLNRINPEFSRLPKSIRKHIRQGKAEGKVDEAKAKKDWEAAMNQPPKIKKRKVSFLSKIEEYIEDFGSDIAKKNLKEFKNYSFEEAKKKLKDFGYDSETEKEKVDDYILKRLQRINELRSIKDEERIFTQEGLSLFYIVLDKVYPKEMNYLMNVNGAGKTILSKLRDKAAKKNI